MKVKQKSEKVGLKLSGLITSWQIDGKTVETVTDLIPGDSQITADSDCNHEILKDTCSLEEKLQPT